MQEAVVHQQVPSQDQFDSWVGSLPERVADAVREHSPFVPHRLKGTSLTVFIAQFQEGGPGQAPVLLSVVAPRAANPGQTQDQTFEGIRPDDLFTLAS